MSRFRVTAAAAVTLFALPSAALAVQKLRVTAGAVELTADGRSTTTLTVRAYGNNGAPFPDGRTVRLASSLGEVTGSGVIAGGSTTFTFTAGTWPGTAVFTSPAGWKVVGDTGVELVAGQPVGTTLHLHGSFSEGDGTMAGHTAQAEAQGVDLLWWTDHDYLYYPEHDLELTGYDFETGTLSYAMPFWGDLGYTDVGWSEQASTFASYLSEVLPGSAHSGAYGWKLRGKAEAGGAWDTASLVLDAWPMTVHFKPVMGEVDFRAFVRPNMATSADVELWINFKLSVGGDGGLRRVLLYDTLTDHTLDDDGYDVHYPMDLVPYQWNEVSVDLTSVVRERFPELGDDAHVGFVEVVIRARRGALAYYDLDDFSWSQQVVGDDLRDLQRAYLDGLPYSPSHLVGAEWGTDPERHVNAFGSAVPLLPYRDRAGWTTADFVDFIHAYGGIASFNHMFGVGFDEADELERAETVVSNIDMLVSEGAFGCDLLEVGYRQRHGLLGDFLEVWDAVSASGLVVTGIGANDQHDQVDWNQYDNRFVTWVESATGAEEDLVWNLLRGAAAFGDPTLFPDGDAASSLTATPAQAVTGQVVGGATEAQTVTFRASPLVPGWQVRLVENGAVTGTFAVEAEGDYEIAAAVDPAGGNVVRFEVITESGEPALYTNPIYFFDAVAPGSVGDERIPAP